MNILFVCSRNKRRSRTAETIFRNLQDHTIKSAGFSTKSPVKISEKLVEWADLILLMEFEHSKRLKTLYRQLPLPAYHVLEIEDKYEYMNEELVQILSNKLSAILSKYA